jgi:hypothetical protein
MYCICFGNNPKLDPESSSEVDGTYFGQLLGQLPFKIGYAPSVLNTVTRFQLPYFSYQNTIHADAHDTIYAC